MVFTPGLYKLLFPCRGQLWQIQTSIHTFRNTGNLIFFVYEPTYFLLQTSVRWQEFNLSKWDSHPHTHPPGLGHWLSMLVSVDTCLLLSGLGLCGSLLSHPDQRLQGFQPALSSLLYHIEVQRMDLLFPHNTRKVKTSVGHRVTSRLLGGTESSPGAVSGRYVEPATSFTRPHTK